MTHPLTLTADGVEYRMNWLPVGKGLLLQERLIEKGLTPDLVETVLDVYEKRGESTPDAAGQALALAYHVVKGLKAADIEFFRATLAEYTYIANDQGAWERLDSKPRHFETVQDLRRLYTFLGKALKLQVIDPLLVPRTSL